tara:strand:- start:5981 stop:7021 length:1041 start_codon:yes stop_codon:yes gene_type:complete
MNINIEDFLISKDDSIKDAISIINKNRGQIGLVIDKNQKLIGTITDGDIRRALLKGKKLEENVNKIYNQRFHSVNPSISRNKILEYMTTEKLHQMPVVNGNGKLLDLILLDDFFQPKSFPNLVVIMAGGFGKRLGKLTSKTPKPLLPIDGTPMIEIIIRRYKQAGFKNFLISVNFEKNKIIKFLGNGSKFNLNIKYIEEKKPLGTAGSLSLIKKHGDIPLIVTNGDVLTKVDFSKLLEFHQIENSDLTIGSAQIQTKIPFGVLKLKNNIVTSIIEKPIINNFINGGIYVINTNILKLIKNNEHLDMNEFINIALKNKKKIKAFPLHEYWIDTGLPETYNQAMQDWK